MTSSKRSHAHAYSSTKSDKSDKSVYIGKRVSITKAIEVVYPHKQKVKETKTPAATTTTMDSFYSRK